MRLWSLHPEYLDTKGILAVWREGLLARKVLLGKTVGYRNHPQLIRFKNSGKPLIAIDAFLSQIVEESNRRGYSFDSSKIKRTNRTGIIAVNRGQVNYEFKHLLNKLKKRDPKRYLEFKRVKMPQVNPIFKVVKGGIEKWEKK